MEAFVTLLQAGGQSRFVTLMRDVGLRKLTERALRDRKRGCERWLRAWEKGC